jgi:hypothetical protein
MDKEINGKKPSPERALPYANAKRLSAFILN